MMGIIAYCAPGQMAAARQLLADREEWADELIEHPFLPNFAGVLLVWPDAVVIRWRGSVIPRAEWERVAQLRADGD